MSVIIATEGVRSGTKTDQQLTNQKRRKQNGNYALLETYRL